MGVACAGLQVQPVLSIETHENRGGGAAPTPDGHASGYALPQEARPRAEAVAIATEAIAAGAPLPYARGMRGGDYRHEMTAAAAPTCARNAPASSVRIPARVAETTFPVRAGAAR